MKASTIRIKARVKRPVNAAKESKSFLWLHRLPLSGFSTPGTTGHQLWAKILDMTSSLQ
jgi:hypothetical protein